MTHVEKLRAAKSFIDTPDKWTREVSARDKFGQPASDYEEDAVCFCIIGAAMRADASLDRHLRKCLPEWAEGSFIDFNDHEETTHADVMALFDRAIEMAESGQ